MKSLATLKNMESAIFQAQKNYVDAVKHNLMETGELRIKGNDEEDLGYPEGLLLSVANRHGYYVDCVYDAIKATDKGIEVHICYYDDHTEAYWQQADEMTDDDLNAVIAAIDWTDDVRNGVREDAPEKVWVVSFESCVDGEPYFSATVCKTEDIAKKILEKEKEWVKEECIHFKGYDPDDDDIEIIEEDHRFYINDKHDDYYEDYTIEEDEIRTQVI